MNSSTEWFLANSKSLTPEELREVSAALLNAADNWEQNDGKIIKTGELKDDLYVSNEDYFDVDLPTTVLAFELEDIIEAAKLKLMHFYKPQPLFKSGTRFQCVMRDGEPIWMLEGATDPWVNYTQWIEDFLNVEELEECKSQES